MARSRSERRHLARVHNQRRLNEGNPRCGNSLTPSGERCTCQLCEASKRAAREWYEQRPARDNTIINQKLSDYIDE